MEDVAAEEGDLALCVEGPVQGDSVKSESLPFVGQQKRKGAKSKNNDIKIWKEKSLINEDR